MSLSRLYDFTDLTVRDPTKVDAELNNIVDYLSGVTTGQCVINFNDSSAPPLTLGQLAKAGIVLDLQASGVTKATIDKTGCWNLPYNSGAPLDLNSNDTVCTGLNVDLLDGISTTAFNSSKALGQFFTGELQITKKATGTQSIKLKQDANTFKLIRTSDNQSLVEFQQMEQSTRIVSLPSTTNLQSAYKPKDEDIYDVARLSELNYTEPTNFWSKSRASATYGANDILFAWVCPCPLPVMKIKHLFYLTANGGGVFTITFYKNGVSIGTVTSTAGVAANLVVSTLVDVSVIENDTIHAKITSFTSNGGNIFVGFDGIW